MSKNAVVPAANKAEETTALDLRTIFSPTPPARVSPIDEYYESAQDLLRRVADPRISADQLIMRLLVLDLVAAAEVYFRRVLSRALIACPYVRRTAQRQMLALGAIPYYGTDNLGYALLENTSFSTQGAVKKQTNNLTGFDIKMGSSVFSALADFDVVCQLRHCLIHARGEAGAQNLMELGLEFASPCRIVLTTFTFQALVVKTHNAVRAYNTFLYRAMLDNWVAKRRLKNDWTQDKEPFSHLYSLFVSRTDAVASKNAWIAYQAFRPALRTD